MRVPRVTKPKLVRHLRHWERANCRRCGYPTTVGDLSKNLICLACIDTANKKRRIMAKAKLPRVDVHIVRKHITAKSRTIPMPPGHAAALRNEMFPDGPHGMQVVNLTICGPAKTGKTALLARILRILDKAGIGYSHRVSDVFDNAKAKKALKSLSGKVAVCIEVVQTPLRAIKG